MLDDNGGVGVQGECAFKFAHLRLGFFFILCVFGIVFVAVVGGCGASLRGEAGVDLFKISVLVVESFKVQSAFSAPCSLIGDGVAEVDIFNGGTAVPAIGGIVGCGGGDEVEGGNLVERRAILADEGLIVVPRGAEVHDVLPYGVAPLAVAVGEELAVDGSDRFFDSGRGVGVERERQRFREIPGHGKLTVPEEVFADRDGHLEIDVDRRTGLLLIVEARHRCQERNGVWQPVELPVLEEGKIFLFRFDQALEGLEGFDVGGVAILERPAIVVCVFILRRGVGFRRFAE